jgi:hypothetical protein
VLCLRAQKLLFLKVYIIKQFRWCFKQFGLSYQKIDQLILFPDPDTCCSALKTATVTSHLKRLSFSYPSHSISQSQFQSRMSKPPTPSNASSSNSTLILRRQLQELTKQPVQGFSAGRLESNCKRERLINGITYRTC